MCDFRKFKFYISKEIKFEVGLGEFNEFRFVWKIKMVLE